MSSCFPSLFSLALNKEAKVADVWESREGAECWFPTFIRPLNDWELKEMIRFLKTLDDHNFWSMGEDKLLLKNAKENGFTVKAMYKSFDTSPAVEFPHRLVWNLAVPQIIGVFAWEASWGKVLTIDQLKRRGLTLVNHGQKNRFFRLIFRRKIGFRRCWKRFSGGKIGSKKIGEKSPIFPINTYIFR